MLRWLMIPSSYESTRRNANETGPERGSARIGPSCRCVVDATDAGTERLPGLFARIRALSDAFRECRPARPVILCPASLQCRGFVSARREIERDFAATCAPMSSAACLRFIGGAGMEATAKDVAEGFFGRRRDSGGRPARRRGRRPTRGCRSRGNKRCSSASAAPNVLLFVLKLLDLQFGPAGRNGLEIFHAYFTGFLSASRVSIRHALSCR